MQKFGKQYSVKILIIYMISALLFLTSTKLHIHTQDTAALADHGHAVSISSIVDELKYENTNDEITVSPESALKVKENSFNLLAVFLLVAIILAFLNQSFIGCMRERRTLLPLLAFHGTPPLRAPPQ